jgi:nucleotide-binding universal stress UspA family protein
MTAKVTLPGETWSGPQDLDPQDGQLMSAVLGVAERAGKQVRPLILRTNNPLYAVMQTARDLQAHELIVGASNKYTVDEQLEQIAFYWINLHKGQPAPLTVRVLSPDRDIYLDLGGGNRIPKQGERHARSAAQLRAAGLGVKRLLFVHDRGPAASDLFQTVLTLLDPKVTLALAILAARLPDEIGDPTFILQDRERARQLGRDLPIHEDLDLPAVVRLAREEKFDLIVLPLAPDQTVSTPGSLDDRTGYLLRHAHCPVFLAALPIIPDEVIDNSPSRY